MTIEPTRRGFLAGLLGTLVVTQLKPVYVELASPAEEKILADYMNLKPPLGWTYQWAATHVLGQPNTSVMERRLEAGWKFVAPEQHQGWVGVDTLQNTIYRGGLALMQLETEKVEAEYARLRAESVKLLPGGWKG
jgi:hypothetical protein